ncbi:MAG: type III pantothenate kinase [candidate division Zixibacteria bacterium]|nr:type III pantothenate kinase [candidate division Zixibacteria bacterium]
MLIAIDIGNTNTVVGVYDAATLKGSFRVASQHHMTSDEAGFFITGLLNRMQVDLSKVKQVVIGSVVPPLTSVFEETSRKYFGCTPLTVSARIKLPVRVEVDNPDEVGADRIANAAAGFDRFGGPVIVVDFGTATTFDVVSTDGAYIGGVIIPGPETSMAELARKAARLFEIRIEPPDRVVGKSTASALKSGLFYGTVGQVDYIIERIIEETGFVHCTVVATGGLAGGIEKHSRQIKLVDPNLTLDGLRLIAEMN